MTCQWYTTVVMETSAAGAPHAPLTVRELGHVALFVRDLAATRHFYRDLLGLRETGTGKNGRIVFFSAGTHHHDVSCELARLATPAAPKGAPGLYHIAFDVGTSQEDLARARQHAVAHGLEPFGEGPTYFCVRDPDGHEVELYVVVAADAVRTRQIHSTPAASAVTTNANAGR